MISVTYLYYVINKVALALVNLYISWKVVHKGGGYSAFSGFSVINKQFLSAIGLLLSLGELILVQLCYTA